ncbi:unnamed protein product [Schistosoma margrebowiei]|uniref:Uncharacterized protein n=1 Tax=Schistosoma margrebowiei TaxID=48269 RepID=A0A3P8D192_9TREM|nr:unnamed protein product [Schistosoma margrebowiei]
MTNIYLITNQDMDLDKDYQVQHHRLVENAKLFHLLSLDINKLINHVNEY